MFSRFDPNRMMYPKAKQNRVHGSDKVLTPIRKNFLKAAYINFVLLQLLFLGLFVYVFGSLYQQTGRIHALDVLYVDFDGGSIGQAVRGAYGSLKGDGFPTLKERQASDFEIGSLRGEVCQRNYWAVIYTSPGASDRLEAALAGSGASTYDPSNVLTYIWNQALYPAVVDSAISSSIQSLSSAARVLYSTNETFASVEASDPAAIAVFSNPWTLESINIQPTSQGSRLIYNSLVIILILIQEFFYLGTINGLYAQFKIYTKVYPRRIIAYRNAISLSYTLIGSLCVTGSIWAFKAGWAVDGKQFALSWAILWLFAHLNFLALDLFTVWLAAPYIPMALITWVIFNVASILLPFELSNGFYRWGYAMPAHEVYQVLIDIWSGGCNPRLHYALPILILWEIIGLCGSALGVYRRCHYAVIAEEAAEKAFRDRVDAAIAFEKKHDQERDEAMEIRRTMGILKEESGEKSRDAEIVGEEEAEREAIEENIRNEDNILKREQTSASRTCNFGPSFGFTTYGPEDRDDEDNERRRKRGVTL
ncbi:hypothetical protein LZ554_009427 [Drepanopeziza brunnea f. sp. 'monogermtubi']|nr:hypothetical protein LZ554_009427 [Drepanopeziza brunnea f. sp. 'monogermtubi']